MALLQLAYTSYLTTLEPKVVTDILEISVRNNQRDQITGMMVHCDGNVIQVIEGEEDAVSKTFTRILLDMRHAGIFIMYEREIEQRDFGAWHMGYARLKQADLDRTPYAASIFEARERELERKVRPGEALQVLKSFAESIDARRM